MIRSALALFGLLIGCSSPDAFKDRLLATVRSDMEVLEPFAFSADGREAAYRAKLEDDSWVAVRGTWMSSRLDFV